MDDTNDTQKTVNNDNTGSEDNAVQTNATDSTQDDTKLTSAREDLKAVLQVGLTVQMVSVIVAFAIKKGKEDFLKRLNALLLDFNTDLSEDEKKELQEDTNRMIETKAEELVESLGEELSPEEIDQAIAEMKEVAQSQQETIAA